MGAIRDLIDNAIKSTKDENAFDLSIDLTLYYMYNVYESTENYLTKSLYCPHIWINLLEWLGKNIHKLKKSQKDMMDSDFNFKKILLSAKIETHSERRDYLYMWINRKGKDYPKLVNILIDIYPNYEDIKLVKSELGLTTPIEELEKQYERLQNGKSK